MKILVLTPENKYTGTTPEQLYANKLVDLGHEVRLKEGKCTGEDGEWCDVVVALSEVTCEAAHQISVNHNKPFYAHMEWVPRWRVGIENEKNWGFETRTLGTKIKKSFINQYANYVYHWASAHHKTLAAKCFMPDIQKFLKNKTNYLPKYLGPNNHYLDIAKEDVKEQNEITCVARFVPHKRLHHVIVALRTIGFDGTLNLVGYGPEIGLYNEMNKLEKDSLGDPIKIKIWQSDDKIEAIQRSKFVVAFWSGIVPAEAAWLDKPCITYESDYMRELYGDTLLYVENNNLDKLCVMIKLMLDAPKADREEIARDCKQQIMEGKINVHTLEKTVEELEFHIMFAIKNYEEKNI